MNYVYALCYLPWVLLLSARLAEAPSRQGWVALALTFALQLACGHPQIFWLSAIASGLFTTGWLAFSPWGASWRRWLRTEILLLGASIAAMALLGIVLVPFLELVTQSNRAHASLPFSGSFSMEGIQWLSLLWPTWGAFGVNWEYNLFVGPAVAVGGLVAFARWREPAVRGLIVLAAGGALIAAGSSTPLFRVLYAVVPGMHSFRVPARAGILITAALILGAAMAADRKGPGRRAAAGLCLAVLAGVVLYAAAHQADPGATTWLAFQAALACLAGAGWWLWIGAGGGHGPSARAGGAVLALALLLSLGLSVFGIKRSYRFQTEFPGEATVLEAVHAGKADLMAAPARVCVDSTVFRENAGMVYHVASVIGYESLSLGRVWGLPASRRGRRSLASLQHDSRRADHQRGALAPFVQPFGQPSAGIGPHQGGAFAGPEGLSRDAPADCPGQPRGDRGDGLRRGLPRDGACRAREFERTRSGFRTHIRKRHGYALCLERSGRRGSKPGPRPPCRRGGVVPRMDRGHRRPAGSMHSGE